MQKEKENLDICSRVRFDVVLESKHQLLLDLLYKNGCITEQVKNIMNTEIELAKKEKMCNGL